MLCFADGDSDMPSIPQLKFFHQTNNRWTIDSICQRCYVKVASSTWEADLDRAEAAHKCEREQLKQFEMTHKPPFRATWPPKKLPVRSEADDLNKHGGYSIFFTY